MKKLIVFLLVALCTFFVFHLDASAKRRPFIRGVFVAWYPMCTPGPVCCHSSGFDNEYILLDELHVNHGWGWEYPEAVWTDSICNQSYGAIRKSCYGLEDNVDNACNCVCAVRWIRADKGFEARDGSCRLSDRNAVDLRTRDITVSDSDNGAKAPFFS